ncbi:hypothetical protein [Pseudaquabacterium rugosum]|uniref:Tetratricopeptide repeat protein n=1 Tax=Pseudaquabacterium rugosum TaxID=2984194 RepID=A0ABU9BAI2_9BURK
MSHRRIRAHRGIARGWSATALLTLVLAAHAPAQAQPQDPVRAEVAAPLQAAQELIRAGRPAEALARIQAAADVPSRNPQETYLTERLRGMAAAAAGDEAQALAAYDAALATGRLPEGERAGVLEALAATAHRLQRPAQVIAYAQAHAQAGGRSANVLRLRINAHAMQADHLALIAVLQQQLADGERALLPLDEPLLRMLAASQARVPDEAGYLDTLALLLRLSPKPAYWADVLSRIARTPGMLDRQALDYLRLAEAVGGLERAEDRTELVQLALQAGQPAEALRIADAAPVVLRPTSGPEAERLRRLRELAARQVQEDRATLRAASAQGRPAEAALSTGLALVHAGQTADGLALMEQAVRRPDVRRPDEARLHLGQAQLVAGDAARAAETFAGIVGTDAIAVLARFWRVHALGHASRNAPV